MAVIIRWFFFKPSPCRSLSCSLFWLYSFSVGTVSNEKVWSSFIRFIGDNRQWRNAAAAPCCRAELNNETERTDASYPNFIFYFPRQIKIKKFRWLVLRCTEKRKRSVTVASWRPRLLPTMFHAPFVAGRKGDYLKRRTVSLFRTKLWKAGRST